MEEITDEIFAFETDFRLPGGVVFRSRMSVIEVGQGDLLLHSPVLLNERETAALEDRGTVRWIVAPSDLHHTDLAATAARYPDAEVLAGANVRKRYPELRFGLALENGLPEPASGQLLPIGLSGAPRWNEHVFVHRSTRTLFCSDLVFNIPTAPNFLTGLVLSMVGCRDRFAQSRSVRWLFMRDREALSHSVAELMALDFDRIVMGHGDVVDAHGKERLADALHWIWSPAHPMLEAATD